MDKSMVKFAREGDPSLLVWRVPPVLMEGEPTEVQTYVLPLMSRPGGVLVAIPDKILSSGLLLDAMIKEESGVLGPSKEFNVQLMVEEEIGSGIVDLESTVTFLAVDLSDAALVDMREYDVVTDSTEPIIPYDADEPNALPKVNLILPSIQEWIETLALERLNFYSAREEQESVPLPASRKAVPKKAGKTTLATLASQLQSMQQQLQVVAAQQDALSREHPAIAGSAGPAQEPFPGPMIGKVPSLSAGLMAGTVPKTAARLVGPPPRTKQVPVLPAPAVAQEADPALGSQPEGAGNQVFNTLTQQSAALTQLVAHITGGDPMTELASSSSSTGLSLNTRGVARREKMQNDLAMRTSNYFLQVQQQLYKRMNPARAVPKTAEDLGQADISMTAYMERYGGYRNCKETGLIMWILSHAMDSAAQEDFHATKEYLALLTASLEQSALDGGWGIAYVLSLMEEPPQQIFADRLQPLSAVGRPFAPFVPPAWSSVALSYMKELEILTTRKTEAKKAPVVQAPPSVAATDTSSSPSPKRKPRFPRKPKAAPETN
jgi:hypothetical protein